MSEPLQLTVSSAGSFFNVDHVTPLSELTGGPAVVRFIGNGQSFFDNTTSVPVQLAGEVNPGQGWVLEARVPWSVFELAGPPAQLDAALFAVFDNDGELDGDRSAQASILTNVPGAFFQEPPTWGALATE